MEKIRPGDLKEAKKKYKDVRKDKNKNTWSGEERDDHVKSSALGSWFPVLKMPKLAREEGWRIGLQVNIARVSCEGEVMSVYVRIVCSGVIFFVDFTWSLCCCVISECNCKSLEGGDCSCKATCGSGG